MPSFNEAETVASTLDLSAGQLVKGRYRIIRPLGGGGFGAVYLTEDVALGNRPVVVKLLHREMLANPAARMKFDDEKMALIKLSERRHPGIGDIYDSGALPDGAPFLAMAFIPGVTLADKLAKSAQAGQMLSLGEVAAIVEQLGDALATAHEVGVIHRDVKPSNVMLAPQSAGGERVVLIDFGIARLTDPATGDPNRPATGLMATIPYAAPEQLCAGRDISPACDVYAFSVLTFELLTGRRPFPDVGLGEVIEQRRRGPSERASALRPGVPPDVDDLLAAGLSYHPTARPTDVRLFAQRLAAALRQSRTTVPQTAFDEPTVAVTASATNPDHSTRRRPAASLPPTLPAVAPQAAAPQSGVTEWIAPLQAEPGRTAKLQRRRALWLIVAGAPALAVAVGLGWRRLAPYADPGASPAPPPAPPVAERGFTYAIQVRKTRNGRPYGEPFWGSGGEILETGHQFRLDITPDTDGDLYVFADGKNAAGKPELNILFPTPPHNNGVAAVAAGQAVQTGWNTLRGSTGDEMLFIVLTTARPPLLEEARADCFANGGSLRSAALAGQLRDFLAQAAVAAPPAEYVADERRPRGRVRATGATAACRLTLQHR